MIEAYKDWINLIAIEKLSWLIKKKKKKKQGDEYSDGLATVLSKPSFSWPSPKMREEVCLLMEIKVSIMDLQPLKDTNDLLLKGI